MKACTTSPDGKEAKMQEVNTDVKPICQTLGLESNVYALIGRVSRTLQAAGLESKVDEFVHRSMSMSDYGELVTLSREYVEFS